MLFYLLDLGLSLSWAYDNFLFKLGFWLTQKRFLVLQEASVSPYEFFVTVQTALHASLASLILASEVLLGMMESLLST